MTNNQKNQVERIGKSILAQFAMAHTQINDLSALRKEGEEKSEYGKYLSERVMKSRNELCILAFNHFILDSGERVTTQEALKLLDTDFEHEIEKLDNHLTAYANEMIEKEEDEKPRCEDATS